MTRGPLAQGRPDFDTFKWRKRMASLFRGVVTDDDVIGVIEHVTDMATHSNDVAWATLFLAYVMGKPGGSDPQQGGSIQVDGDLAIQINQLTPEQLAATEAALKTIDAAFTPVALPAAEPH
jgi:hypothetical protein